MKKLIAATLSALLIASSAANVLAASAKCEVKTVDKNLVTLDCGDKADNFKVGSQVKVKSEKKKAIEGC